MHDLSKRILEGDTRAVARALRSVDDRTGPWLTVLKELFPHTGRAYVVGVTGNPGAGKSTLTDRLIEAYRKADKRVGVVCVDPSSPYTGGAILGDRIRMSRHALDPKVFIRSVATRGHLGGLSRSARDMVRVLDAAGCDVIDVSSGQTVAEAKPAYGRMWQAFLSDLVRNEARVPTIAFSGRPASG